MSQLKSNQNIHAKEMELCTVVTLTKSAKGKWFVWRLVKKKPEQEFLILLLQYYSVGKTPFLWAVDIQSIDIWGKSAVQAVFF